MSTKIQRAPDDSSLRPFAKSEDSEEQRQEAASFVAMTASFDAMTASFDVMMTL